MVPILIILQARYEAFFISFIIQGQLIDIYNIVFVPNNLDTRSLSSNMQSFESANWQDCQHGTSIQYHLVFLRLFISNVTVNIR